MLSPITTKIRPTSSKGSHPCQLLHSSGVIHKEVGSLKKEDSSYSIVGSVSKLVSINRANEKQKQDVASRPLVAVLFDLSCQFISSLSIFLCTTTKPLAFSQLAHLSSLSFSFQQHQHQSLCHHQSLAQLCLPSLSSLDRFLHRCCIIKLKLQLSLIIQFLTNAVPCCCVKVAVAIISWRNCFFWFNPSPSTARQANELQQDLLSDRHSTSHARKKCVFYCKPKRKQASGGTGATCSTTPLLHSSILYCRHLYTEHDTLSLSS